MQYISLSCEVYCYFCPVRYIWPKGSAAYVFMERLPDKIGSQLDMITKTSAMDKLFTSLLSARRVFLLSFFLCSFSPAFAQKNIPRIYYENFSVPVVKANTAISKTINFKSNPEASAFRTKITEAYQQKGNVFAGHFKVAVFGCGGSCIMGYAIDMLTGNLYDLPLGEEGSCLFAEDRALYKANSNLFVSGVCKENPERKTLFYLAFLFQQDNKHPDKWTFKKVQSKEFLARK